MPLTLEGNEYLEFARSTVAICSTASSHSSQILLLSQTVRDTHLTGRWHLNVDGCFKAVGAIATKNMTTYELFREVLNILMLS